MVSFWFLACASSRSNSRARSFSCSPSASSFASPRAAFSRTEARFSLSPFRAAFNSPTRALYSRSVSSSSFLRAAIWDSSSCFKAPASCKSRFRRSISACLSLLLFFQMPLSCCRLASCALRSSVSRSAFASCDSLPRISASIFPRSPSSSDCRLAMHCSFSSA